METLEKKIEDLKKKHEIEIISAEFGSEMEALFPDMEVLAYAREWNGVHKTLNIEPKTKEDFQEILKLLPPTNKETRIGSAGKDEKILKSPFRLDLINPCQTGRFSSFEMKVYYDSNGINLRIKVPIELVTDFIKRGSRYITDSEHHYFIGSSHSELRKMTVTQYYWNNPNYMSWYGGNKTLMDTKEIKEVIKHLRSK